VVEDEATIADAVAERLRSEGFADAVAADGLQALEEFARLEPDLLVLDLMLPGLDGLEEGRLVQRERPVPVLVLTARDSEDDLVDGRGTGGGDYLTKPLSARELVARVHALLRRVDRRADATPGPTLTLGRVHVDTEARRVRCGDGPVHLTPTEFDLLVHLLA